MKRPKMIFLAVLILIGIFCTFIIQYANSVNFTSTPKWLQPTEIGYYNGTQPNLHWEMSFSDNLVYMVGSDYGLWIINITDPYNPVKVGEFGSNFSNVFVTEKIAYVQKEDLRILNVSDPRNVTEISRFQIENVSFVDLDVIGDIAYMTTFENGLKILNVSDPSTPSLLGELNTVTTLAFSISVYNNFAYILNNNRTLEIINVTIPENPDKIAEIPTSPIIMVGFHIADDILYLYDRMFNVTDPSNPTEIGSYNGSRGLNDVYILGDFAYLLGNNRLDIVNILNLSNPFLVTSYSRYDWGLYGFTVYATSDLIFVLDQNFGLRIIDSGYDSDGDNLSNVAERYLYNSNPNDLFDPFYPTSFFILMGLIISLISISIILTTILIKTKIKKEKIRDFETDILTSEKMIVNHDFNEANQKLMDLHQKIELLDFTDYSQKIENLMKTCRINSGFLEQKKNLMDKLDKREIRSAYTGLVELLKEVNKPEYMDWIDPSVKSEIAESLKIVTGNL